MARLLGTSLILGILTLSLRTTEAKWVEGRIDTKEVSFKLHSTRFVPNIGLN